MTLPLDNPPTLANLTLAILFRPTLAKPTVKISVFHCFLFGFFEINCLGFFFCVFQPGTLKCVRFRTLAVV